MPKPVEFYVTDWSSNGTNDLFIVDPANGEVVEVLVEVCFGIDVLRLGSDAVLIDGDNEVWPISADVIKRHVATSPVEGTFEKNCKALSQYLA